MPAQIDVLTADADGGLAEAARLLRDFNLEYDDPSPPADELARLLHARVAAGDAVILLARDTDGEAVGVAALRLSPSLWSSALEAYLAELYVVPARRGHGFGRALITTVLDLSRDRGADYALVVTSETDTQAQRLYEAAGFRRTEGAGGPLMLAYERDLEA